MPDFVMQASARFGCDQCAETRLVRLAELRRAALQAAPGRLAAYFHLLDGEFIFDSIQREPGMS
jgi:hypothetical protein